jgi:hypothetical protein
MYIRGSTLRIHERCTRSCDMQQHKLRLKPLYTPHRYWISSGSAWPQIDWTSITVLQCIALNIHFSTNYTNSCSKFSYTKSPLSSHSRWWELLQPSRLIWSKVQETNLSNIIFKHSVAYTCVFPSMQLLIFLQLFYSLSQHVLTPTGHRQVILFAKTVNYSNINCFLLYMFYWSRDSVVGITTSYGLDDRRVGVRVLVEFSLLQIVQTGSEFHPTSYTMDTGGSFPGGKATGAWSWPLTSN